MKLTTLLAILLCIFGTTMAQQNAAFIGPEKGTLIIVGGGQVGSEIWTAFITAAGGVDKASIVIIPTAGEDSAIATGKSSEKVTLEKLGVKNITLLHTRNPKVADTDTFIAPLKNATGVWFVGGRQWKLVDAYLNTATHKALQDVLSRGGVIGGTSAGATIQGSFLLRGDTKGNTVLIGDHVKGLDFIHNVAIDQHILRRNRQFDLIAVVKKYPELLGIGIDESTAIVVQQNSFKVIGNSYVAIYDAKNFDGANNNPSGESGNAGAFFFLSKGQQFNLQTRKIIAPNNISN